MKKNLGAQKKATEKEKISAKSKEGSRKAIETLGWIIGFLLTIYLLGFRIAIPLFAFLYLKSHHKGWALSASLAVLVTIAILAIFEWSIGTKLYRGLIFELL
jgi:VIT1/CCC1 family predicted Fe2+/Mn2+ transporter